MQVKDTDTLYKFVIVVITREVCNLFRKFCLLFWGKYTKISGTTKSMNMKFLPDVGIYKEAQNQDKNLA